MTPVRLRLACALLLVLVAPGAAATVYKCLLEDGRVFYQDAPCAPGRELRDFDKDPANVSIVPFGQPAPAPPPAAKSSGRGSGSAKAAAQPKPKAGSAARVPKPPSKPAARAAERGDPAQRKFLRPGMGEGEVMARVGPPDMTSSGGRKGTRWTYMPVPEDEHTITNLQFENGRLVEVERKVLR